MRSFHKKILLVTTGLSLTYACAMPVHAATTVVNGGGATIAADPSANPAVSFLTDHTATVNNGINVTGAVQNNTGTSGLGTLSLSGANTIAGNIGAAGAALKNVNITATNVTINGDVYVSAFSGLYHAGAYTTNLNGNLYGNSDIGNGTTLNLGSGYKITGKAWSGIGGSGIFNINGDTVWTSSTEPTGASNINTVAFNNAGIVTLGVDLDSDNIQFKNTTQTTLASNVNFSARNQTGNTAMAVQNTAALDINDKTMAVTGTVNFAAGTTLNTKTTGQITSTSTATVNTNTNVNVTVGAGSSAYNGQSIVLINGTGGTNVATLAGGRLMTNSGVISFAQDTTNQADLVVVATRAAYNQYATINSGNQDYNAANTLNTLAYNGTASGDMATVTSTLDGYSDTQMNQELNKLAPVIATTVVEPTLHATILSQDTISGRMNGFHASGVSSGDAPLDRAAWVKAFGSYDRQDEKGGFDGYTAKTGGLTLGADQDYKEGRLGVAFSYSDTTVDVEDTHPNDSTDINSYRIALYGSKEYGAAYLNGQLGYSLHDYEGTRATALGRTAESSYYGHEFSAVVGGGYRFAFNNNLFLTPYADLGLSHLHQNSYTEKGAGALNMSVDDNDVSRVRTSIGTRISGTANVQGAVFTPEVHAAWNHEFADVSTDTTSRFSGGGASFVTPGQDTDRNSYTLGTGVSFKADDGLNLSATYDYETRDEFDGHNLQLTARWSF